MVKEVRSAVVDPKDDRNIKFINKDIESTDKVQIRLRGQDGHRNQQVFIESDMGVVRIGIGQQVDKESGETYSSLYLHQVEKREVKQDASVTL